MNNHPIAKIINAVKKIEKENGKPNIMILNKKEKVVFLKKP